MVAARKPEIHQLRWPPCNRQGFHISDDQHRRDPCSLGLFESILIRSHSLKPKTSTISGRHPFPQKFRVEADSGFVRWQMRLMIVAARTDALILRQLSFSTTCPQPGISQKCRAEFPVFCRPLPDCWLSENCHVTYARAAVAHERRTRPRVSKSARTRST